MSIDREWRLLVASLVVNDSLACVAALALSAWVVSQPASGGHIGRQYWILIALIVPAALLIFAGHGLYDTRNLISGSQEYSAIFRSCTYLLVALIVLGFAVRISVSREWTLLSWVAAAVLVGVSRFGIRKLAGNLRSRGWFTSPALLVGADAQSGAIVWQLSRTPSGMRLVGVLDDYLPPGTVIAGQLKVLGVSSMLPDVVDRTGARHVILVPQALPWESLQILLATATAAPNRLSIHLLAGFYDLLAAGVRLSRRNGIPLLTVNEVALTRIEAVLKRCLDCTFAAGLLLLLSPLGIVQILRMHMKGQEHRLQRERILGRDGQTFDLLSFGVASSGQSTLIRKLPSLLNVLAGQLSLVGPRPISSRIAVSESRLRNPSALRPGLTGLWRDSQDPTEQSLLDLYYVRGYSVWLDLQILFGRLKAHLGMQPRRLQISETTPLKPA